jgi:hypothetical protein
MELIMTNCDNCGEDHSTDIVEAHKRAAEAVVAANSADRAALNERAKATLEEAREAWPSISDDDLASFFQSQAILVERFSRMDVLSLANILDAVFANCTLAAATLAGAYDLNDVDTPKRDIADIVSEARQAATERLAEDDLPFPGNYM